MKRLLAIVIVLALAVCCCACKPSSDSSIDNVIPLTSELTNVTSDPNNSVAPLVTDTPNQSAGPSDSATPQGSASPVASATPKASGTPAPQRTSAVSATAQVTSSDVDVYSGWTSMVANSAYIVIGTISKDVGVVDTLEGTETRKLAPNAYIGDWQYELNVTEVLKTADKGKISRNTTITLSYPYERCMNIQTKPMERDDTYVALKEENSYVLFLDYDEELGFYTPAGFEPNKFSLSGSTLYILTGKTGLDMAWEAGAGKTGVTLSSLETACK